MSTSPDSSPHRKRKRTTKAEEEPVLPNPSNGDSDSSDDSKSDSSDNAEGDVTRDAEPEAPALSHAERRRQRKKEKFQEKLKEADEEDQPPNKKRKKEDKAKGISKGSNEGKRQNSVWVGNMSFKTTTSNLEGFFASIGQITRINMPTKPATRPGGTPENRGFAYVDFATPEAKLAAIALSEQPLIGRRLLIKDGDDFAGRPTPAAEPATDVNGDTATKSLTGHSKTAQKILKLQKQPPAPTLFFGNLGFNTTVESIRELLDAHRSKKIDRKTDAEDEKPANNTDWIRKVRMGTFEDSGLCKGFAFVDFVTIADATAALVNPKNHHLDGRKLLVEYASPDAVRRGGGPRTPGNAAGPRKSNSSGYHGKQDRQPKNRTPRSTFDEGAQDLPTESGDHEDGQTKSERPPRRGPAQSGRSRPRPGAALALAKRESAAIIPSAGKKITF